MNRWAKRITILGLCTLIGCQQSVPTSGFKPEPVYDGPKNEDRIIVDEKGQLVEDKDAEQVKVVAGNAGATGPGAAVSDNGGNVKPAGTERLNLELPVGHVGTLSLAIDQYDYAVKTNKKKLKSQAVDMMSSVFAQPGFFQPVTFSHSPYYHLFLAQSQPEFFKATSGLQSIFENQKTAIMNILGATSFSIQNLPTAMSLDQALKITSDYVAEFETRVENSKTLKLEVKNGIRDAMNERFWIKIDKARATLSQSPAGTQSFSQALEQMTQFIAQFEVELTEEEGASLKQAQVISNDLNRELTAKETLAFLINIWESMPEAEREEAFAKTSPELHEFLLSKDEKQRNCLKATKCKNLILRIVRGLFILPKLKKMGIENIQKQISDAAFEKLNTAITDAARNSILSLPQRLQKEIFAELDKEQARYQGYRDNYPTFLAEELGAWFELEFGKKDLGYIPKDLSPQNLSVSIMALIRLAESLPEGSKKNEIQLSLLNILLMHGGFNTLDKKGFSSLLVSRKANGQIMPVNLESFVLPVGQIGYKTGNGVKLALQERQQMMRAFRELLYQLKPVKKAGWIDNVDVSLFFSKVDAEGLKRKAFPRDAFMALAVANYVAFLYDLEWSSGPLFFMCKENKLAWLGKKQDCEKPTTLVSVADLPFTSAEISTRSHARFLNEILEFFEFVSEIQTTKNSYLKPHLKKFSQIKPQLHKLSVSLSNFLSHTLVQESGEVCSKFNVNERKCTGSIKDIFAYQASVEALKNSFQYLNINAYQSVVLSSYYVLNQKYLSQETGFYNFNKGAVRRIALLNSISIVENAAQIEKHQESKTQAQQLLQKWNLML